VNVLTTNHSRDERNTVADSSPSLLPVAPETLDADETIAPMLDFVRSASGGRLLNMHMQMAASALVLDQYTALRRAIGAHAKLDVKPRAAVAIAASAAGHGDYTLAVNAMLARRAGWTNEQVTAITDGRSSGNARTDALLEVVREAAGGDGTVSGASWDAATDAGWTTEELAETYGYIALVSYCDRFVRYARTEFDLAFAVAAG
jgi:alkylhydroperoxidase/carboxymuconolactone decarboxylase family protein YurZ